MTDMQKNIDKVYDGYTDNDMKCNPESWNLCVIQNFKFFIAEFFLSYSHIIILYNPNPVWIRLINTVG